MLHKNKQAVGNVDGVYTPFIGGYWTKAIKFLISLHLIVYFLQIVSLLIFQRDIPASFLAINMGAENTFWRFLTSSFVHSPVPIELAFSIMSFAFLCGDLERKWGLSGFLFFYFFMHVVVALARLSINCNMPQYSSFTYSIGFLWALYFHHPFRMIYGKISVRSFIVLITLFMAFLSGIRCLLAAHQHQLAAMLALEFIGIPAAFCFVRYLPVIYQKIKLWQILNEVHYIHDSDILLQRTDKILDKISCNGFSMLTSKDHRELREASKILRKLHKTQKEIF